MVSVTPEGLWMVSYRIIDFRFFVKFHKSGPAKIFSFWNIIFIKKAPSQAKDLINMVCVTPDGLWKVSDRTVKSRLYVKFHRSGPAIIFGFSTIIEHGSYPSKKLLVKQKTSSRWWVFLRMDYGWFLIELSNFDFSSHLTGPDLQKFSVFELSWSPLVIHQKSS